MKRIKLSDVLKSRTFRQSASDFDKTAEPNPFDDLDSTENDDIAPDDYFSGDEFRDIMRDIDGNEIDFNKVAKSSSIRRSRHDYADHIDNDKDDLYLTGKDRSYKQNEFNHPDDINDIDVDAGWAFMRSLSDLHDEDPTMNDEDLVGDPDEIDVKGGGDSESDEDNIDSEDNISKSGKYEGVVRAVKGAYLVSKKKTPDDTYTEVWLYNIGKKFEIESNIRKTILSGTDIDPIKNFSEDGSQEAVLKTVGNVQFLTLTGLAD